MAENLGLLKENKTILTSTQLKTMTDDQLKQEVQNIAVIARALPTDKSRLVRICQEMNKVVGMTGYVYPSKYVRLFFLEILHYLWKIIKFQSLKF